MPFQQDLAKRHPQHWMDSEDVESDGSKSEILYIPSPTEAGIACENFMSVQFNKGYPIILPGLLPLRNFVAHALKRTNYHKSGMITPALILIQRYRLAFPGENLLDRDYHPLFIAALMIAADFLLDEVYGSKSWEGVARECGLSFSALDLNRGETDVCRRLGWKLTFKREELRSFHAKMFPWPKSVATTSSNNLPRSQFISPDHSMPHMQIHAPARDRSVPPQAATRHQYIAAPGPLPPNTSKYTQPRPRTLSHSQGGVYTSNYTLNTARPADHFPYDTRPNVPSTHANRDPLPRMFSDTYVSKPAVRHYNLEVYHPTIEEMRLARRRPRTPSPPPPPYPGHETSRRSQSVVRDTYPVPERRRERKTSTTHYPSSSTTHYPGVTEDRGRGRERNRKTSTIEKPRSRSVAYNGYTSEAESHEHKSSKRGRSKSRHEKTREKEPFAYSNTGSKIYDWHTGRELLPPKKEKRSGRRERERSSSRAPPGYY
ncbi:hypothetical protein VNI00_014083 [Paramarasmius palmivorus]|uniref:Cyclin N-terminal domain-containing protein n=1 Tax=Paramarasmius palmivorus TaxID=297713 RepID=A0AAW0BYT3_9AGAR